MTTNPFVGKPAAPTSEELTSALAGAKAVWDQLLARLDQEPCANGLEWKCYSLKTGWSLRVKRKSRTIIWLSPGTGCFQVTFILGEKAMAAARQARLPQRLLDLLENAPKYPEGRVVRITLKTARNLPSIKALAAVKAAN